ncbi:hypothetical protein KFL_002890090 [Klebsormidium nitens]|uniref:Sugar phosphate transporter domain-containing protein n=1 Tax=Klebsormidium nitens TaxID=105231 RepID=A0A1Y1I913_KLENI|nr:hypothetical protein KFL_002890090 [Klebsormidium nitens]|eukprot:GAQ86442.1 hypothetical protein KFL_002890090 [Klebsormidium nitens]
MISIAFLETLSDLRQSGVMKKGFGMAHLLSSLLGPVGGWRRGKAGQEKGDHQGKHNELDRKQWISFLASIFYAAVAVAMGVINKAVIIDFQYPNTFLTLQMAASAALIYALKWTGVLWVRKFEWKTAYALAPVVFFYNANVAFALASLKTLNLPMYHVLKRITPVLILGVKSLMGNVQPPWQVSASVLTIVGGTFIAGVGDIRFDMTAYGLAFMSCVLQATYLLLVERSGGEKGMTSLELLLYNSILSLPVLVVLICVTGEVYDSVPAVFTTAATHGSYFLLNLIVSLFIGVLLNYSLFLCTLVNSALTTTVVGALKGVVATLVGFFIFRQGDFSPLNILGITINTAGGFWYTAAKYQQRRAKCKESPLPTAAISDRSSKSAQDLLPTASGSLLPLFEAARAEEPQRASMITKLRENGHVSPLIVGSRRNHESGASRFDPAEVLTPGLNIRDRGVIYAEDHRERSDNSSPRRGSGSPHKGHKRASGEELV